VTLTVEVLYAGRRRWVRRPPLGDPPPGWLLTLTLDGHGRYARRGTSFTTDRGDMVLVGRDLPPVTDLRPGDHWEFLLVKFDGRGWRPPGVFRPVADGLYRAHIASGRTLMRIQDAFGRIIADARERETARVLRRMPSGVADAEDASVGSALMAITLTEIFLLAAKARHELAALDGRIVAALERIGQDLEAAHSVGSLARQANLSPSRFAHLFRQQVGVSPMRMLLELRLQEAALRLVHSEDPVAVIAADVGLTSGFDLSRRFKRHFGVSPRAFREASRAPR
jgi:AraC family transcriptional regulator of arabinose operon